VTAAIVALTLLGLIIALADVMIKLSTRDDDCDDW
jgi:hypothetical protein